MKIIFIVLHPFGGMFFTRSAKSGGGRALSGGRAPARGRRVDCGGLPRLALPHPHERVVTLAIGRETLR
jgi:hypothetical protein